MQIFPQLLELNIKNESDLDCPTALPGIFKTHLHLNIDKSLAENIPLEFSGNAQELKWKVIELVKVPIEELLYAYAPEQHNLFLLDKKKWQEKINLTDLKKFQIEKITLEGYPLRGLEMNEPVLHYAQIKNSLKVLGLSAAGLLIFILVLSFFLKAPAYQTLASLKENTQNLKIELQQLIETEKELSLQKEKSILQKKWLKVFKNLPQHLPALVKLSEINLDEPGQLLQLKGESKNQTLLQNWAKQVPDFEITQIQLLTSPNTGYQFSASIHSGSQP